MIELTTEQWHLVADVAEGLGIPKSTRDQWRYRKSIPWRYRPKIAAIASERGQSLPVAFLEAKRATRAGVGT